MKLYHGTNVAFAAIDLDEGRVGKDFGVGFYLTPDISIAQRQAERKVRQKNEGSPIIQAYEWDKEKSLELKIVSFSCYSLEWAEFILLNRNNKSRIQAHAYDVVIGPIADDTVGFQIRRLEDGIINMSQFLEEIKYHQVTMQYFFATDKAIKTLQKL